MDIVGNYSLSVEIGGTQTAIHPQTIRELTITLDAERLLPVFKLVVADATDILSQIVPYDKDANTLRIQFSRQPDLSKHNAMVFRVKRRRSLYPDQLYSITGVLDLPDVLVDDKSRSFVGNVKTNLQMLAIEMGTDASEIGSSLNYTKTLVQPNWTNAKFLRHLRENIIGRDGEAGYLTFVKVQNGRSTLVVKSLNELLSNPVSHKLLVGHSGTRDFYPVTQYRVYDDSKLYADMGAQVQNYSYFDWGTGKYVDASVPISDCPALSEYFLVDSDQVSDGRLFIGTGRSNDVTEDFEGIVRNDYYRRTNSLVTFWASTWGIQNAAPGDKVYLVFSDALQRDNLFLYQHTGFWMVKRVVHVLGSTYMTNLELVRCGIDTDIRNALLKTTNRVFG